MKRIIITSVCALALSLFGAFGTNVNSMNAEAQTNTVMRTTQVVQNMTNKECKEIAAKNLSSKKVSKKDLAKKNSAMKKSLMKKVANATAVNNKKPVPTTKPAPTTAPVPTTKPSTSTNTSGISNYANQVLQLVNQERANAGLSALTTNATITSAANKRAQETAQSFSHTRPNGSSFSTVLKEYGVPFRAAGENIAYGQKTPQEVVTGWMNSPGHRANILKSSFGKIGIGVYQTNGVIYWTQVFTD